MTQEAAIPARRGFFARIAGATAIGLSGLSSARAATPGEGPDWPGPLKGRHKQVTDAFTVNEGFPLYFTLAFLAPNAGSATGVVILRHTAVPMALNHAMWAKYKIGEALKITDPGTKAIALKNPFFTPAPGALRTDNAAIDKMLASGVVFGACNQALHALSAEFAANAGVTPGEAMKDWAANIIPGITVIPSGTWGLNRAQEAGCTYCSGG